LFAEAIATVNRTIATGLERDRGILAAFGADHGIHLTWALAVSTTAFVAACLTAGGATLGLVGETFRRVIRLIIRAEGEGLPAVLAREGSILVVHR